MIVFRKNVRNNKKDEKFVYTSYLKDLLQMFSEIAKRNK